jgi:hypothetical protein
VNPRFWHIHPEADRRFDAWMRHSLTLKDCPVIMIENPDHVRRRRECSWPCRPAVSRPGVVLAVRLSKPP